MLVGRRPTSRRIPRRLAVAVAASLSFGVMESSAQPSGSSALEPPAVSTTSRAPLRSGDKRKTPDYDGRPEKPDDGENAGTWTLRVVFFPAYLVSEYLVRRPLGWATVQAERSNLVNALVDFFTFGPNREAMLVPTALIDFGFKPSVGFFLSWRDAFAEGNTLRLNAATWGSRWLRLSLTDRYRLDDRSEIGVHLEGWRRPDWLFWGLGPLSDADADGRYQRTDLSAAVRFQLELPRTSLFTAYASVHAADFEDRACCDDPSIGERVAEGFYPLPPGFSGGYQMVRHGFELALDTRLPRPASGSGLRLVARAEQNARLGGEAPDQWLRYGAAAAGFLDLSGHDRVIGLYLAAAFADPVGKNAGEIPFTEQILLGGSAPLRGFLEGRLVDRSALIAKLEYTWPVWVLLDGSLSMEAGNVFDRYLSNFEPELARLSFTMGVRAHGRRDQPFEALVGLGTKPLQEGAEIDSFRVVFGANHGF